MHAQNPSRVIYVMQARSCKGIAGFKCYIDIAKHPSLRATRAALLSQSCWQSGCVRVPSSPARVRVIYKAPRSRVRVDTAGEDEAEPQARPSTSQPDPPVHGDEGPYINRVVWSEMNATASGLYVSAHVACRVSAQTDIGSARSRVSTDTRSAHRRVSTDTRSAHRPCMLSDISTRGATP